MEKITLLITIVFAILILSGCTPTTNSNTEPENNNAINSITLDNTQIEFIPSYLTDVECKILDSCYVEFRIKNTGDNTIKIKISSYTHELKIEERYNKDDFQIISHSSDFILNPNETSIIIQEEIIPDRNVPLGVHYLELPPIYLLTLDNHEVGALSTRLKVQLKVLSNPNYVD